MSEQLIKATRDGDIAGVKQALANGAKVDYMPNGHASALIWASWAGHTEIVKELLKKGADHSLLDSNNKSAIQYAKGEKREAVVAILREHIDSLRKWERTGNRQIKRINFIDDGLIRVTDHYDFEDKVCTTILNHASGSVTHSRDTFDRIQPSLLLKAAQELKKQGGMPGSFLARVEQKKPALLPPPEKLSL